MACVPGAERMGEPSGVPRPERSRWLGVLLALWALTAAATEPASPAAVAAGSSGRAPAEAEPTRIAAATPSAPSELGSRQPQGAESAAVPVAIGDGPPPRSTPTATSTPRLQGLPPAASEPAQPTPPTAPVTAAATVAVAADTGGPFGPPELDVRSDPSSPQFIGPPLVPPLELLGTRVLPGTKEQLRWSAGQGFAGGDTVSPVLVAHGSRPGPLLCLVAAIHGDEINGVEIVRRVFNASNPDRLSGSLIAVPIVNLFGFARGSRYLPDRRDLNRHFPGSPRGSIAARVAHSFFDQVVRRCHGIVDFHTGSFDRSNLPQVRADLRMSAVVSFVRGFGALPVLHSDGSKGMLRVAASAVGIPAVTFEVGAPGQLVVSEIESAREAIDALMHSLGMTPDEPMEQEPQAVFYDSLWARADSGGMLVAEVALGQRVERGDRLGVVVDPLRNLEREVLAPVTGRVIGMARNQVVLPGFAVFHIGMQTSAEEASDAAATGGIVDVVEEDPDPPPRDDDAEGEY